MSRLWLGVKIRVHGDAAAAIGTVKRRRVGKIHQLDVEDLWVQAKVRDQVVDLGGARVKNTGRLPHNTCQAALTKMLKLMVMSIVQGQSGAAPESPPDSALTPTGQSKRNGRVLRYNTITYGTTLGGSYGTSVHKWTKWTNIEME